MTNSTSVTFECLWAFNVYTAKIKRRTLSAIIFLALWTVLLVAWIVLGMVKPLRFSVPLTILCILMVIYHGFLLVFLNVTLKKKVKKNPQIGALSRFTFEEEVFTEDFVSPSTRSQSRTAYSALVKVAESEDYLYLFNQTTTAFIVSKAGFETGSAEALKAMLRAKLPPEKIKFK